MTQEKNSSKLDRLQGVLLDDRDFLKQVVQAFCKRLLEEEMAQHLQAEAYQRTKRRHEVYELL